MDQKTDKVEAIENRDIEKQKIPRNTPNKIVGHLAKTMRNWLQKVQDGDLCPAVDAADCRVRNSYGDDVKKHKQSVEKIFLINMNVINTYVYVPSEAICRISGAA